jgi:hypothetical protein
VTRPVKELAGFARAELAPGQSARITFVLHTDRLAFTGRDLRRVIEPGTVEVQVGASSEDVRLRGSFEVAGDVRAVEGSRRLTTPAFVNFLEAQP